jgi:hypothetical protein
MVYEGGANTRGIVNGALWLDNCDFGNHCGCLSYSGFRLSLFDKTANKSAIVQLEAIMKYGIYNNFPMIIGVDSNSQSELWGSSEINMEGNCI